MRSLRLLPLLLLGAGCLGAPTFTIGCGGRAADEEPLAASEQRLSTGLVISGFYGAGGNTGATWANDYVEIFNRGITPVPLSGLSLQYASASGTTWSVFPLSASATLQPGQYWLVQLAGGANGATLPVAPDESGTSINMAAASGKIALVNGTTTLGSTGGSTSATVIDFVGYGTANDSETAPAPAISTILAGVRGGAGCTETDDNATDFTAVSTSSVVLHDSASATTSCSAVDAGIDAADAIIDTSVVDSTIDAAEASVDAVADSDDGATADTAIADSTTVDSVADTSVADSGTTDSAIADVAADTATTTDSSTTADASADAPPVGKGQVVISGFYGAGGGSGAIFTNDYVELFNRGPAAASLSGLSVQYASSTGTAWNTVALTNATLAVGQYYLVQLSSSGSSGAALPTADKTGSIAMSATAGKLALVNGTAALSACGSSCSGDPSVLDFVGYGSANDYEKAAAPAIGAGTAGVRLGGGCVDTNDNSADFTAEASPTVHDTASPLNDCSTVVVDAGTDATTADTGTVADTAIDDTATGDDASLPDTGTATDTAVPTDTAVANDTGTTPTDTGTKSDAGRLPLPVDEPTPACSCSTPGGGSTSDATALALVPVGLAIALGRARRRRRG